MPDPHTAVIGGTYAEGPMRERTSLLISVFAALLGASGCAPTPPETCRDYLRAIGDAAERCGGDREAAEDAVEDGFRREHGAGCGGADEVRDVDDFYDVCIPWVEALTCEELASPSLTLPPECRDQIIFLR